MPQKVKTQQPVIFGASGDLTERKLVPAVYDLYLRGYLPENYALVGVSRTQFSDEAFRNKVVLNNQHLKGKASDQDKMEAFAKMLYYQPIDTSASEDYARLVERLNRLDDKLDLGNNITFYLSTPPSLYETIAKNLAQNGLNERHEGWKRLIIEKPFGYNLDSAQYLNKELLKCFKEDQI